MVTTAITVCPDSLDKFERITILPHFHNNVWVFVYFSDLILYIRSDLLLDQRKNIINFQADACESNDHQ